MKAIIVAAGMGKRLGALTAEKPKCMLKFKGKTLLEIQLEALRANGMNDISVVVGYKKECIDYPGLKYYFNDRFERNNILCSLFYAEKEMDSAFMVLYSDIVINAEIVRKTAECGSDIAVVADIDWKKNYIGRDGHPEEEAENVVIDKAGLVRYIGKKLPDKSAANGEFLGMMKFSDKGAMVIREHYARVKREYDGKPFQAARVFENAYLTDMVQELVDSGVVVDSVRIKGGWKEVDTPWDYDQVR